MASNNYMNYMNRAIQYRENLLSIIDYDGFPHKFPSDYNWLIRQRSAKKNGELNREYEKVLNNILPGWNDDTYTMLTNVRGIKLQELASYGHSDIGILAEKLPADNAYIMAKFGFSSVDSVLRIPCNAMFIKGDYYNSLTNYIYQRSVADDYNMATMLQQNILHLAKINYPGIAKELLAAHWFVREPNVVNRYVGKNMYMFNFVAIASSQEYCGVKIDDSIAAILQDREVVAFANKYKSTLSKLCICFTNKQYFEEIIATTEFKKMYQEIKGNATNIKSVNNNVETPHTVDRTIQSSIKREKKSAPTGGLRGLFAMFSRDKSVDYDTSRDETKRKLKPKGPANGYGENDITGDEYNTGYVGTTGNGGHGGHSFGEYVAAASAVGLIDFDGDDDGDSGDFDD